MILKVSIDFNNRSFKKFAVEQNYFFKYHRHARLNVDVFSQSFDDMDKKIRLLAKNLYVVKKSLIPFFKTIKRIAKKIGINEMTKEIIDEYYFVPFSSKFIFAPLTWRMFNSYSYKLLPQKMFDVWN